jgi:hypothetical protein
MCYDGVNVPIRGGLPSGSRWPDAHGATQRIAATSRPVTGSDRLMAIDHWPGLSDGHLPSRSNSTAQSRAAPPAAHCCGAIAELASGTIDSASDGERIDLRQP